MSRVGKQIIQIPAGTTVVFTNGVLTVKGPKGNIEKKFRDEVTITVDGSTVTFAPKKENDIFAKALWGTYASHVKNMVDGVNNGFSKKLVLEGVGFKSAVNGKSLDLALGFSHPVNMPIPEGLTVTAEKNNITITGVDKEMVGAFAANVRNMKKPEPYKGKGFRYDTEVIRRKQGKKSA